MVCLCWLRRWWQLVSRRPSLCCEAPGGPTIRKTGMGGRRKMALPYRRYSVPEAVMRKYWVSREKTKVDREAQTEWRPCVVWASSGAGGARSSSEPSLRGGTGGGGGRPVSAPSTPSWTSSSLPPGTTSSSGGPLTSRSPRPGPSVQVLCIHHDVLKADVVVQVPSSSTGTPAYADAAVSADFSEESTHEIAVQTISQSPSSPEENSKYCQTSFASTPPSSTPFLDTPRTYKSDFSCQTGRSSKMTTTFKQLHSLKKNHTDPFTRPIIRKIPDLNSNYKSLSFDETLLPSLSRDRQSIGTQAKLPPIKRNPQSSCSNANYKDFPGTEMVVPRYSAFPRSSSMVVNMSSHDNSSDSDLSLTDSLEDPSERTSNPHWPTNKLDERLVRGEVTQIRRNERTLIRSKNTFAYFLFLSGEEDSIKEYKVPDKVKVRLKRREEEAKRFFELKNSKPPKVNYTKRINLFKGKRDQRIPKEPFQCKVYTVHKCVSPKHCPNDSRRLVNTPENNDPCQTCGAERRREESTQTSKEEEEKAKELEKLKAEEETKKVKEEEKKLEETKKEENAKKVNEVFEVVSQSKEKSLTSTISKDESNSKISLTLTVPSKPQVKDDLSIDEKVAKVLLESLEEIRESQATKDRDESQVASNYSERYLQVPGSYEDEIDVGEPSYSQPVSLHVPTLKQTAQRVQWESKSDDQYRMKRSPQTKHYTSPQHSPERPKRYEDERYPKMGMADMRTATSRFLKSEQSLENEFESADIGEYSRKNDEEHEELLRAILKKSMQGQQQASVVKGKEPHSEVCELGMKFLSNEIDIDQFLAGIPLERIEQDVKRLMYKHFLGSDQTPRDAVTSEALSNKKVVVSIVEADGGDQNSKCQCKNQVGQSIPVVCTLCHPLKQDSAVQVSTPKKTEKVEKCVSPLDSSVATAVQTLDSFLDTERLPVIKENSENKTISISSNKEHSNDCKFFEINTDSRFVEMKYNCGCKNSNSENVRVYHEMPNNQNQNSISPRPVKTSIKNNLRGKQDETVLSSVSQTDRPDIKKHSCVETPRRPPQESTRKTVPTKTSDSKNIYIQERNEKAVEKRGKLNTNKRVMLGGSKFTQMFEVIPEERGTPYEAYDSENRGHRRRTQSLGRDDYGSHSFKESNPGSRRTERNTTVDFSNGHKEEKLKSTPRKVQVDRYDKMKSRSEKEEDEKKPVVVGRFRPDEHTEKKGRKDKNNDDMLNLSKGWIDFYLLRDNEDISQRGSRDKGERCRDDRSKRRLPDLPRKGYKSESSECSLPELRSSGSSSPSSPDARHPRHVEPLPNVHDYKSKKRNRNYNEDERHEHRRSNMVQSEHSMSSVHSTTGVSEGSTRDDESKSFKSKKGNGKSQSSSANNACWTVTVAGSGGDTNQPPPDVEMRLCFARDKDGQLVVAKKEARYPPEETYPDDSAEEKQLSARSSSRHYHSYAEPSIKKERSLIGRGISS